MSEECPIVKPECSRSDKEDVSMGAAREILLE